MVEAAVIEATMMEITVKRQPSHAQMCRHGATTLHAAGKAIKTDPTKAAEDRRVTMNQVQDGPGGLPQTTLRWFQGVQASLRLLFHRADTARGRGQEGGPPSYHVRPRHRAGLAILLGRLMNSQVDVRTGVVIALPSGRGTLIVAIDRIVDWEGSYWQALWERVIWPLKTKLEAEDHEYVIEHCELADVRPRWQSIELCHAVGARMQASIR